MNSKAGIGVPILSKLGDRNLLLLGGVFGLSSAGDCDLEGSRDSDLLRLELEDFGIQPAADVLRE